MFTYTLNGETYFVSGDRLYVTLDEEHELDDIDDHPVHLYESDEYRQYLARLDWGGSIHRSVKITAIDERGPPKRYVDAEDFTSATPVTTIVPDGINTCPGCGGWAGDESEDPRCLTCGYGYDDVDTDADNESPAAE